jgi:diguanylate cyclase
MNRDNLPLVHTNRPASRRSQRRLAFSAVAPCVAGAHAFHGAAATLGAPAQGSVHLQQAGTFELLAAELRIAELERALAEAHAAASTDVLTGALNRRGFAKASQCELARARRSGARFALAHIDLDDFKRLNDTLGHQTGDRALVHLVELLHRSMRPSDVVCRFGGEEFVLMLPDTGLEEAGAALSRFLGEFSAQVIPGTDWRMTFSAGVVVPGLDESIEQAIARADAATYVAKRAGKNRVVTG